METKRLLSVRDVAKYLNVVPMTVYRLIDRGELVAVKVGRVWRVSWDELRTYLDRNRSARTPSREDGP